MKTGRADLLPLRAQRSKTSPSVGACVGRVLFIVMLFAAPARADISVHASVSPSRAQVGEPITLAIDMKGAQNAGAPALGSIDGFNVQYVGPSTQVSIVNGEVNASVQHRYSLLPLRAGHFTLGPFAIDYQGKRYETAEVSVEVVAAGQPGRVAPGQTSAPEAAGTGAQPLRLTLSVPQQEAYLHERIPLDVTLYVGASVRVGDVQYPSLAADGLSVDKFPDPVQRQQVIDGQTFQVLYFHTAVVPLRAGTLSLGPATLRLNVLSRRRGRGMFNDPFFERFFEDDPFSTERRPVDLHSEPITLTVLPLPEQGKPPTFSGAVGNFTLQVSAAPTELNAGDPITLRMVVSGTGNLADAGPPELSNAESLRTYEPRVSKADESSKSFEQVLMPNDAGVHAVPPVRFSYFDPQARRYQTLESQPIALVVRAPQQAQGLNIVAGGATTPVHAEEKLGRDIVYIKDDPGWWAKRSQPWYGGLPFLLWQPVPPALLLAAVWYDRRRQRLSGDARYARFSRAGKQARRGLAEAERALARRDRQQFYDAVWRTMQEYLASKLDVPPGAIVSETVAGCGLPDASVQRIREFFTTCEQVRFAPGAADGDMRGTLALARKIVRAWERERYGSRSASAAAAELRGTA